MVINYSVIKEEEQGPYLDTLQSSYDIPFRKKNADKTGINGLDIVVGLFSQELSRAGFRGQRLHVPKDTATGRKQIVDVGEEHNMKNFVCVSVDNCKRLTNISIVGDSENYPSMSKAFSEYCSRS